jgi:signal transduction histidine kinase
MKRLWRDTLFKRLFLLMWASLVVSHLVAYTVVTTWLIDRPGGSGGTFLSRAPVLPSLPPTPGLPGQPLRDRGERLHPPGMGPGQGRGMADGPGFGPPPEPDVPDGPAGPPQHERWPGLPMSALLADYGLRFLIIGIAAWLGARWVSAPMRRLAEASRSLAASIGGNTSPPRLDEHAGTVEVREAAHVFNDMGRQLEEQFKGRGLLVAAISHDLRTPLTRMRVRLETIEHDAAQRCIADVREMNELIDSSLELFRGASTTEALQPLDVLSLVQSLGDDLVEQGHAVTVNGHTSAIVSAQPTALRRVLSNLLSNALRYGDKADVTVLRDDGRVNIHIDDAGPGIPPQHMDAVFQPFYRIESSRNRGTGGTGLGLYIARDLLQRQGGSLALANRSEGGLRATITLPLRH